VIPIKNYFYISLKLYYLSVFFILNLFPFKKSGEERFLHPKIMQEMYELSVESVPFFKSFEISDLSQVLQAVFGERLASGVPYPEAESPEYPKKTLELIWTFIIEAFSRHTDLTRAQKIQLLAPIKDWPLIPVDTSIQSNCVKLAPIRDFEVIKVSNSHSTFDPIMRKIFQQFPNIRANFFTYTPFYKLTDTLAMNMKFDSDFVVLLSHMTPASFGLDESETVCRALETMIHKRYQTLKRYRTHKKYYFDYVVEYVLLKENEEKLSLRSETELRKMVRELPIFKSFPSENLLVSLGSSNVQVLIDPTEKPYKETLPENLIKKYLEAKNILLIKHMSYEKLRDYLKIKNKSLSLFYEEYLTWSFQNELLEETNAKREHMKILNDQFNNEISGL